MADYKTAFLAQVKIQVPELYEKIVRIKESTGIDDVIRDQYSLVFLLDILFRSENNQVNPDAVMREIRFMEGVGNHDSTGKTKHATMFTRLPLKGLWHKHYYQGSLDQLAHNVQSALNQYGLPYCQRKIIEAKESGEERYFSEEDIPHIVNDIVSRNLSTRRAEGKMTGGWIVYAIHEDKNYYLCLSDHTESDEKIRLRIEKIQYEFNFLSSILH